MPFNASRITTGLLVTYTVADLIKATDANPRTIKYWVDRGLIRATKASEGGGHGIYRQFTRNELILACLLLPLAMGRRGNQTRTISELEELAKQIRLTIRIEEDVFEEAVAGKEHHYLILTWIFGGEIQSWVTPPAGVAKQLYFPGVVAYLQTNPGRAEVLYLNGWLQPLRNM
jgi:hypothetical protein